MSGITLVVEDQDWRSHRGIQTRMKQAADAARKAAKLKGGFTILLADDKKLRALNLDFRGKDKPTNVLSFTSDDPAYWGDVAIALGVVKREAREQGKTVPAHAAHLAAHGILHLKGYDLAKESDRASMERIEILILSALGLPDPYGRRPYARSARAVN